MKGEKLQMRINYLTSFAAGILITTSITAAVYFTEDTNTSKAAAKPAKEAKVQVTEEEMKAKLEAAGYVVQNQAEIEKENAKAADAQQAAAEQAEPKQVTTEVVINVTEGMTSIDVGEMLVNAKLTENAFDFAKNIESRGLTQKLRPGTYTVNSAMTFDEMVAAIYK